MRIFGKSFVSGKNGQPWLLIFMALTPLMIALLAESYFLNLVQPANRQVPALLATIFDSLISEHTLLFGAVLLNFGATLIFCRRYSHTISKLTNAAQDIGAGDLGQRIVPSGPGELKSLANAFNLMAEKLEENNQQRDSLQKKLETLVITDELTGAYNRRELNRLMIQEFRRAKRFDRPLSMILYDIDHFKTINDHYGHLLGDQVLIWLTNIIAKNTRTTNFVARFGGDEFVILLPETSSQNAYYAAERLRELIASSIFYAEEQNNNSVEFSITVSMGIAELTTEMKSVETFFSAADRALYQSKSGGRNRTQIASGQIMSAYQ